MLCLTVEASKQLQCVGVSEQETLGMKGTPIIVCIFGFLFPPTLQQSVLKACGLCFRSVLLFLRDTVYRMDQ